MTEARVTGRHWQERVVLRQETRNGFARLSVTDIFHSTLTQLPQNLIDGILFHL
jgi:hypothetical protein